MLFLETEDIKYSLIKQIGYGSSCSVYKGYPSEDPSKFVAIKIYKEKCKTFYNKEISIHETLKNTNLFISLEKYGMGYIYYKEENPLFINENNIYQMEKVYYIIEEIAENGELFDYIYVLKTGFNDKICAKIFLNIVKSLQLLHKKRIIHCDIKPENVLIGNDFNIRLIDFGYSEYVSKNNNIIHSTSGSDTYCSPEIRRSYMEGYDGIKSDIFSLGVLLFVIRVGKFPFKYSIYNDKRYRLIMEKNYESYWNGFKKENLSEEFKDLINHLICYDPDDRFSLDEVLRHPWIIKNSNYSENNENNKDNNYHRVDEDVINELKYRKNYMNTNS